MTRGIERSGSGTDIKGKFSRGSIAAWLHSASLRASVSLPQKRSLHISKTAAAQRTSSSIKYRSGCNSKVDAELICASQATLSLVRGKVALFESYSKVARFVCLPLLKPPSSRRLQPPVLRLVSVKLCLLAPSSIVVWELGAWLKINFRSD